MIRFALAILMVLFPLLSMAGDGERAAAAAKSWRQAHEREILSDFSALLALPNVADNLDDMERNAEHITGLLEPRGFAVQLLRAGGAPAVFAQRITPGASKTLLIYAHYDGQPVDPETWANDPFTPTLRDGPMGDVVDLANHHGPLDPQWRLYARSAGDDKAPLTALTAALDALGAASISPSVNIKLFLDGEEEQGSTTLAGILNKYGDLLAADMMLFCDGPMHQSRRPLLVYGVRGDATLDMTIYGPARPLHSGQIASRPGRHADVLRRFPASRCP